MNKLYQVKHELWLDILFASFAVENREIKERLYDFSMIAFRHMKWLGESLLEKGDEYNYDRTKMLHKRRSNFEIFQSLIREIKAAQEVYEPGVLTARIITDENYLIQYLASLLENSKNDAKVTAFDMHRTMPGKNLDPMQTDALTIFLFEESYKEYELILLYAGPHRGPAPFQRFPGPDRRIAFSSQVIRQHDGTDGHPCPAPRTPRDDLQGHRYREVHH